MAIQFRKAAKKAAWLRMGISGPAGAGKTFTALKIVTELALSDPGKILMIDTQRGQGDHYGNQFDFDIYPMTDHHPERFMEAMREAVKAGYKYIILDSVTHEWTGNNGCLEWHDEVARRTKNTFTAWKEVTPVHNKFFDTINSIQAHVIGTLRSKMDHVQDVDDSGKKVVKKMGIGTIQREGSDYEFDVLMEMDIDHCGVITKSRDGDSGAKLDGKAFKKPGTDFVEQLRLWMADESRHGALALSSPTAIDTERAEVLLAMKAIYEANGAADWDEYAAKQTFHNWSLSQLQARLAKWQDAAKKKAAEATVAEPAPDVIDAEVEEVDPRADLRARIDLLKEQAVASGLAPKNIERRVREWAGDQSLASVTVEALQSVHDNLQSLLPKTA